jgi:hypothetical protein
MRWGLGRVALSRWGAGFAARMPKSPQLRQNWHTRVRARLPCSPLERERGRQVQDAAARWARYIGRESSAHQVLPPDLAHQGGGSAPIGSDLTARAPLFERCSREHLHQTSSLVEGCGDRRRHGDQPNRHDQAPDDRRLLLPRMWRLEPDIEAGVTELPLRDSGPAVSGVRLKLHHFRLIWGGNDAVEKEASRP